MTDSQTKLEKIFLSYPRILEKLKSQNITTKNNKEITEHDVRTAIDIMNKKHPICRWKCRKNRIRNYVLVEGYYWLIYVYFQKEKILIDADIDFFELRIKQYEELLEIEPIQFFENDLKIKDLNDFFYRSDETIKRAIIKMNKQTNKIYIYLENGEKKISKEGVEWLAKNCFKRKYLELLEEYKMELTEIYIDRCYPYDIFLAGFYFLFRLNYIKAIIIL